MKILISLLFLSLLNQVIAQELKNQYDQDGNLFGYWEFLDNENNKYLSANYRDGKPIDTLTFYENGLTALKLFEVSKEKIWFLLSQENSEFFRIRNGNNFVYKSKDGTEITPSESIKHFLETSAVFNGGSNAWSTFLQKNLEYPEKMVRKKKEGKVIVSFVVNRQGKVTRPEIIDSPNKQFNKAVLNLFENMPNWQPGLQRGYPVSSRMTTVITFKL